MRVTYQIYTRVCLFKCAPSFAFNISVQFCLCLSSFLFVLHTLGHTLFHNLLYLFVFCCCVKAGKQIIIIYFCHHNVTKVLVLVTFSFPLKNILYTSSRLKDEKKISPIGGHNKNKSSRFQKNSLKPN